MGIDFRYFLPYFCAVTIVFLAFLMPVYLVVFEHGEADMVKREHDFDSFIFKTGLLGTIVPKRRNDRS
jgi:hypothetical protein